MVTLPNFEDVYILAVRPRVKDLKDLKEKLLLCVRYRKADVCFRQRVDKHLAAIQEEMGGEFVEEGVHDLRGLSDDIILPESAHLPYARLVRLLKYAY